MRILVLIYEYPPIGGGGGKAAQEICEGLAKRGHELQVLTSHFGDLPRLDENPNLMIRRIEVHRKQAFRAGLNTMLSYVLAASRQGVKIAREWKPDVLHVHFAVPCGAAAWWVNRVTHIPYVLTAHLGDVPGGSPQKTARWFRWVKPFTPPIWKNAARVVAVSQYTRQLALEHYPVEICVIPNGVDLQGVKPSHIEPHTPPRLVFAGRFVEQKNPLQIIRTLAQLADLPWSCTLAGDGALRQEMEAEINSHHLQDRFDLPGWVMPEQVLECYAESDILFMPSRTEGLSVVGVEALAMGLAMVLGKAGGNLELVEQGENGYLVDPDDTAGFVKALRGLLDDPDRLRSARLKSRVMAERFDVQRVVDAYEQLFKEVVAQQ
ncbi:MAG: glycosyltransferase family 4 protein [Chloroflexi bacterium]|nr:glycosyltransferase family 4 protein [Chloroflexota bacterium]